MGDFHVFHFLLGPHAVVSGVLPHFLLWVQLGHIQRVPVRAELEMDDRTGSVAELLFLLSRSARGSRGESACASGCKCVKTISRQFLIASVPSSYGIIGYARNGSRAAEARTSLVMSRTKGFRSWFPTNLPSPPASTPCSLPGKTLSIDDRTQIEECGTVPAIVSAAKWWR